jgi:hypothetical protein
MCLREIGRTGDAKLDVPDARGDRQRPGAGHERLVQVAADRVGLKACGEIITANQVMMEVDLYIGDETSWCFHADCFMLWNTERGQL